MDLIAACSNTNYSSVTLVEFDYQRSSTSFGSPPKETRFRNKAEYSRGQRSDQGRSSVRPGATGSHVRGPVAHVFGRETCSRAAPATWRRGYVGIDDAD